MFCTTENKISKLDNPPNFGAEIQTETKNKAAKNRGKEI